MPGDFVTVERFESEIRKFKGKIGAKLNQSDVSFFDIIWLDTYINKTGLTTDDAWHDLDLTSDTSANAKGVIIWAKVSRAAGSAIRYIYTRKNGSSATNGEGGVGGGGEGGTSTWNNVAQWHQACDSGQVIEYKVQTSSSVTFFYIVGYWEESSGGAGGGAANDYIESNPTSGQYKIKGLRLDSSKHILITYDETPEP